MIPLTQQAESTSERIARQSVGGLMSIAAVILFMFSMVTLILLPLLGGMAMVAGGGNASDDSIRNTWWAIMGITASPFVVTALLAIAGINLLQCKRRILTALASGIVTLVCVTFVVAAASTQSLYEGAEASGVSHFLWLWLICAFIPFAGLVIALRMKPRIYAEPLPAQRHEAIHQAPKVSAAPQTSLFALHRHYIRKLRIWIWTVSLLTTVFAIG